MHKFMRRPEVQAITGLPTSTLYEMMHKGEFPKAMRIGEKSVVWLESEIFEWQNKILKQNGREIPES